MVRWSRICCIQTSVWTVTLTYTGMAQDGTTTRWDVSFNQILLFQIQGQVGHMIDIPMLETTLLGIMIQTGHYRMSGGGPPYPNPTPSPGYDPETVLDPTPAKTPEPINSGNPVVISPVPVPEPWVSSKVAPPGEFDYKGNYLGEPPDVEGLPDDKWEWHDSFPNHEPGYTNEEDPGFVWSPHKGRVNDNGTEGEASHWHRKPQGTPRGGQIFPPDYQWGRGGQRSYPGEYDEKTGLYGSVNYGPSFEFTKDQVNEVLIFGGIMAGVKAFEVILSIPTGIPFYLLPY